MTGGELKSFDRVADVYDATRGLPDDVAAQVADGLAGLLSGIGKTPRLLEVGIGTGRMAVPLAARGVRVTGIDIAPAMLALLLGKSREISVMLAEASHPPLRPRSFDAALFVHILHLVPDAEATVRATLGLVRGGGMAIAGGDDHRDSIRAEADAVIQRTVLDLSGVDMRGGEPYIHGQQTFDRVARELGADVETVRFAEWSSTTTARRIVERLEARDFSSAWKIPDETMPELLARVRPSVESLFGGYETPVSYKRSFSATVARLPF